MSLIPELNSDEENAIEELRKRMKTSLSSEMYQDTLLLYRFLKARNFLVDDAEAMLRKNLKWKKTYQTDTILEDFKPIKFYIKYAAPDILGFDKGGNLLVYTPAGKFESKDAYKCIKKHDFLKHLIWNAEFFISCIMEQIAKGRKCNRKVALIFDLDQLTFGNVTRKDTIELLLNIINHYQNNYPEYLEVLYMINAPSYYILAYSILKTIMSDAMLQKIHIYGTSGWKEKLLENIDPDVLPAFLGGNRTDPDGDPLCRSFVKKGGAYAPECILTHEDRYFRGKSEIKIITIPKGQKKKIIVGEQNVGSVIHWEFYCKSTIGFGLFREIEDNKLKEVIPTMKYETSDGTETGAYKVKSRGKYIIIFDNTFSWLNSKEVQYDIQVKKSES